MIEKAYCISFRLQKYEYLLSQQNYFYKLTFGVVPVIMQHIYIQHICKTIKHGYIHSSEIQKKS